MPWSRNLVTKGRRIGLRLVFALCGFANVAACAKARGTQDLRQVSPGTCEDPVRQDVDGPCAIVVPWLEFNMYASLQGQYVPEFERIRNNEVPLTVREVHRGVGGETLWSSDAVFDSVVTSGQIIIESEYPLVPSLGPGDIVLHRKSWEYDSCYAHDGVFGEAVLSDASGAPLLVVSNPATVADGGIGYSPTLTSTLRLGWVDVGCAVNPNAPSIKSVALTIMDESGQTHVIRIGERKAIQWGGKRHCVLVSHARMSLDGNGGCSSASVSVYREDFMERLSAPQ